MVRKIIYMGVSSAVLIFGLVLFSNFSLAQNSNNTHEDDRKIEAQNAEIERLEAEILAFKKELEKTQSETYTLANAVKEIDLNQKKLDADLKLIEEKIKKTNLKLGKIGTEIEDKNDTINGLKRAVAVGARKMHESDGTSFLVYLLREETMSDAWREFDSFQTIESHFNDNLTKISNARVELEGKKTITEGEKKEILSLKNDLDVQKKIILANKNEKERLLKDSKTEESAYKKMIAENEKKKEQFEEEIRKIEEGIDYNLIVKDLPKGVAFSWPLEKIIITQKFGKTSSSGRLYKSGTHSGVDFGAPIGTPVYAMADGIVEGVGDTDIKCPRISYGRFILIKYDNGLASTYAHLSVMTATAGQKVIRGQLVGYTGNTGYSTGPHLHVSIYARDAVNLQTLPSISCKGKILTQPIAPTGSYLDPLKYLPAL